MLGHWAGMLIMTAVFAVQALLLQDGGLIVMDEGRIVADGLTHEVLSDESFLLAHGLEKP